MLRYLKHCFISGNARRFQWRDNSSSSKEESKLKLLRVMLIFVCYHVRFKNSCKLFEIREMPLWCSQLFSQLKYKIFECWCRNMWYPSLRFPEFSVVEQNLAASTRFNHQTWEYPRFMLISNRGRSSYLGLGGVQGPQKFNHEIVPTWGPLLIQAYTLLWAPHLSHRVINEVDSAQVHTFEDAA